MEIPFIGIGTFRLKGDVVYDITLSALKNGYNHIDTAKLYGNEREIGRAIKNSTIDRSKIFITTKIWIDDILKGNQRIIKSICNSLQKLDVDYIDLVLLHAPIQEKLIESWKTLENIYLGQILELKNKVRYIGVSNYNICHLNTILQQCSVKPYVNQIEISPYLSRKKLIKYCKNNDIKIVAHTSLTKGIKFNDEKLIKLSNKTKVSIPLLLLCWARSKNFVVLPRTSNLDHLVDNLKCLDIELSEKIIKKLDKFDEGFSTHPKYIID